MPRWRRLLLAFLVLLIATATSDAQQTDIDTEIRTSHPDLPFFEGARALLLERLSRADSAGVADLVAFVDARPGSSRRAWLSPWERLAIAALVPDARLLADSAALHRLLASVQRTAFDPPDFDDLLRSSLRTLVVVTERQVMARYDSTGPSEPARQLLNLLLNRLLVRGLRGSLDLNAKIRAFAAQHDGWRGRIALETLTLPYVEQRYGVAFGVGYATGIFTGPIADILDRAYGPELVGEMYFGPATVQGGLFIGVANAIRPFVAAAEIWDAGHLAMEVASLSGGWEFRRERISMTPMAGVTATSLRSDDSNGITQARTRLRFGAGAALMLGYRIPFDIGTHIDLRVRSGWTLLGTSGYDRRLGGSAWSISFGLALVHRPYRPLP